MGIKMGEKVNNNTFHSTVDVIAMLEHEDNCAYIINRDGDAVFTITNRIIEIMKEVGSNFWQVERENGILHIRSMERVEWIKRWNSGVKGPDLGSPHPKPEVPKEPAKGKVRLI